MKKILVKTSKTWYDNSNEANNKAGHGRFAVTHAPMQETPSYTIAFATPAPIITVFPSFFNT